MKDKKPVELKPDYKASCGTCGQSPTVQEYEGGEHSHDFDMCGACMFGDADCLEPENWGAVNGC